MTEHGEDNVLLRLVAAHVAAGRGDAICYVDAGGANLSYGELYRAAGTLAGVLRAAGARPAGRCLVVSDDTIATVVLVLGLWWCGCVPVPISPLLSAAEIAAVAAHCSADMMYLAVARPKYDQLTGQFAARVVIEPAHVHHAIRTALAGGPQDLPEFAPQCPDAEVLVQYTTRTTGVLHGVRHSARALHAVLDGFGSVLQLDPQDTVLSSVKLSFGYGFGNSLLLPLAAGARTVMLAGAVDAAAVADVLSSRRPTVLFSTAGLYRQLFQVFGAATFGASLRLAVSAGGYLPLQLVRRCAELWGVPMLYGLGATEVLHIVVCGGADSWGRAVPGVVATVRDDTGRTVSDGRTGRLHIAGPSVALGYVDEPDSSLRVFNDHGAYTGDLARRCGDRIDYVCDADDRLDGDSRVYATEIEHVVRGSAGVADCAVVGETDEHGRRQVVAYVIPSSAWACDDVRIEVLSYVRGHLAPARRPTRVEVLPTVPVALAGQFAQQRLRALGSW